MNHLNHFGKVKPVSFHGKLISIKLTLSIKGHIGKTIIFKDSMLSLPLSLRQLCDSFKVFNKKGVFPYLLNDIAYRGQFPNYELFTSISNTEYLNIRDQYSEKIITKAVFLAPKVYALITDQGEQIIKAKGLTKDSIKDINISDYEKLLIKDSSRVFNQYKSYKSLYQGNISVLDTIYTLKTTSNKRQNIYINRIFDNTKPYNYDIF